MHVSDEQHLQEVLSRKEAEMEEALEKMKAQSDRKIAEALEAATKAQKEMASLQTEAASKSKMAMELSASLAKEKLMRKLADRGSKKAQQSVLAAVLNSAADEEDERVRLEERLGQELKLREYERSLAEAEKDRVAQQTLLAETAEEKKAAANANVLNEAVIECQGGLLAGMSWLVSREDHESNAHAVSLPHHVGV
ncbi:hypothetical protein TeGR_g1447, partial [Tetraparma gracilis]